MCIYTLNTGMFSVVFPENSSVTYFTKLYYIYMCVYDNYNMDMSGLPECYVCTSEAQRLGTYIRMYISGGFDIAVMCHNPSL